jgi:transcription elongation factor Elf1
MLNFDQTEVTLDCPGCGHQFKQPIGRLKDDATLHCVSCGQAIRIDAKGLRDLLRSAQESTADLARTIKKLNQ